MAWENPVTTWGQAGKTVPGAGDFNRIEGNTQYLKDEVDSHKAESTQQAHMAKNIGLEDAEGKFTATEVEGAMNELFTNVSNGKDLVGGAITGVDDSVVIPTDPTFQDLANAIGGISTGKKWASGTFESKLGYKNTVTGLPFKPRTIIMHNSRGTRLIYHSGVQYDDGSSAHGTWKILNDGFEFTPAGHSTPSYVHTWEAIE